MGNIILSIKPCFSDRIYDGSKTVELRKKIGDKFRLGEKIYIYSSSPVKKISGHVFIMNIQTLNVQEIKEKYLTHACISEADFDHYYHEHKSGILLWLHAPKQYDKGIPLNLLRKFNFHAPQSFCYVPDNIRHLLREVQ